MNYGQRVISAKRLSMQGIGERLFGKEGDPNGFVPYECVLEDGNTYILFWHPHSDAMSRIVFLPCNWPLSEVTRHMNELSDQGMFPLDNSGMELIKALENSSPL